MEQENMFNLVLSEKALEYTLERGTPIITLDFVGYLGILEPEVDKVMYLVDIEGNFELVSGDKARPKLPLRLKKKWMKWCLRQKFLEYVIEPFPEFNNSLNLPFDESRARVLPVKLIASIEYYKGHKQI